MIDILQSPDGDIDISGGDIALADAYSTTEQHKADILQAAPGDYKAAPLVGVALADYLNDNDDGLMLRTISQQMGRDGIKVQRVGFDTSGKLIIDGDYEQ